MNIIYQITLIFFFSFLGDSIQKLTEVAIPGNIIGLLLLFLALHFKLIKIKDIEKTASFLQKNMGILFVPVTVGLMQYLDILKEHGLSLFIILLLSTLSIYLFTAKFAEKSLAKEQQKHD